MPGIDGLELPRRSAETPSGSQQLFFITARASDEEERSRRAGASHFLRNNRSQGEALLDADPCRA